MKNLLCVALMFISLSAVADKQIPVDRVGIIQYPSCSANGQPVLFVRTDYRMLAMNGVSVAMAKPAPNGQPAVYLDVGAFTKFTPAFQTWILSHECAHWQLGHVGKPAAGNEYMEREADCAAGKRLVRMGLSDDQLNGILELIANDELMMSVGSPSTKYVAVQGARAYTSSFDHRAEYVLSCIDEERLYRPIQP